jgi:hypothetical protein
MANICQIDLKVIDYFKVCICYLYHFLEKEERKHGSHYPKLTFYVKLALVNLYLI